MSVQTRKRRQAVAKAQARNAVDDQFVESLRLEVENRQLRARLELLQSRFDTIVFAFASQAYERFDA